ncbi:SCO5555 family protein [Spiractinospora alimapuensis]
MTRRARSEPPADPEFYEDLAERLRVAHRLAESLPERVRIVVIRRLLVVGESIKRDPWRASERLELLLAELRSQAEDPPTH